MFIDNTQYSMYCKCPLLWYERYESPNDELRKVQQEGLLQAQSTPLPILSEKGIQLIRESDSIAFGSRLHELLHERRLDRMGYRAVRLQTGPDTKASQASSTEPPSDSTSVPAGPNEFQVRQYSPAPECPTEAIEAEAQACLAAYEAHWVSDFEYLESERTSTVELERDCPECSGPGVRKLDLQADKRLCTICGTIYTIHGLVVKLDAVVRYADGTIGPMDTKTESRPGYNTREDWSGKTQGRFYLWALAKLYPNERVSRLVVDVVTRASPKQHRGPVFNRVDDISFTQETLEETLRNLNWVADDIERSQRSGWWRSNTNNCKKGWDRCDYYAIHIGGRTSENLKLYTPAEKYLET